MQKFSYIDKREVFQPEYSQPPILTSPHFLWVVNDVIIIPAFVEMLGSCVGLFLIAVLYEGLKVGRELLQRRMAPSRGKGGEVFSIKTFKVSAG